MVKIGYKEPKGKDFSAELPSEKNHKAICIGAWDVGYQETTWNGKSELKRKILVRFEVAEKMPEDSDYKGKNKCVNRYYTASLFEKAQLRMCVDALRRKKFETAEELAEFDLNEIVGKPCMVKVSHRTGTRKYAVIDQISELPEELEETMFKPDNLYKNDEVPEWVQKIIDRNKDAMSIAVDEEDDDLPF